VSDSSRLPVGYRARLWAGIAVALLICALLPGCSSVSHVIADNWPRVLGGLPEGVPPRDREPPPVLAVHDLPPPRDSSRMSPEERKKYEDELRATRTQTTTEGEETRNTAPGR
jgi:hypothetical protein